MKMLSQTALFLALTSGASALLVGRGISDMTGPLSEVNLMVMVVLRQAVVTSGVVMARSPGRSPSHAAVVLK